MDTQNDKSRQTCIFGPNFFVFFLGSLPTFAASISGLGSWPLLNIHTASYMSVITNHHERNALREVLRQQRVGKLLLKSTIILYFSSTTFLGDGMDMTDKCWDLTLGAGRKPLVGLRAGS